MTLDTEAYVECVRLQGTPGCVYAPTQTIMHKFMLPLVLVRLGVPVIWLDFDVFLVGPDPTPRILEHAESGPYDILVSGSFETPCICSGIYYLRAVPIVESWLLRATHWMYEHPYEHDQRTFAAFLDAGERIATFAPLPDEEIPRWDTLDAGTEFVTAAVLDGNGWIGDESQMLMFHFLNGESDGWASASSDISGNWMRIFADGRDMLDVFFTQEEDLYTSNKSAFEHPVLRAILMESKKSQRRMDRMNETCGVLTLTDELT